MTRTAAPLDDPRPISRREARTLAATENQRMLDLMRSLDEADWHKPTDCTGWTVRDLAGHILGGMEAFASMRELVHQVRRAKRAPADVAFIDAMTELQVRERAGLSVADLLGRLTDAAPRSARFRARMPGLMRRMPMAETVGGVPETWRLGYLLDVILTRDVWMHRIDVSRATGRELVLDAGHDGRIVADVVAEWGRRHGQPYVVHLTGPAGGVHRRGDRGEEHRLDAVEFCRILSGRGTGEGLLAQPVPF